MPASAPAPAPSPLPTVTEQTQGCVRCGARIPLGESMCERCNPLGLKAPAASQAHGTAFLAIVIAVIVMAVVARVLISGIGPFTSNVTNVVADPAGLRVTVTITNEGTAEGSTTCRVDDPALGGISPRAVFVESPRVPAGGTATFDVVVTGFGTTAKPMLAACGS